MQTYSQSVNFVVCFFEKKTQQCPHAASCPAAILQHYLLLLRGSQFQLLADFFWFLTSIFVGNRCMLLLSGFSVFCFNVFLFQTSIDFPLEKIRNQLFKSASQLLHPFYVVTIILVRSQAILCKHHTVIASFHTQHFVFPRIHNSLVSHICLVFCTHVPELPKFSCLYKSPSCSDTSGIVSVSLIPPWSPLTSSSLDQLPQAHLIAFVLGSPAFACVGTSVVFFGSIPILVGDIILQLLEKRAWRVRFLRLMCGNFYFPT